MDDVIVATCNFNTTALTNACLRSFVKNSRLKNYKLLVLDNSDTCKFVPSTHIDFLLDNVEGKLIDYSSDSVKKNFGKSHNNHANVKHAIAIQWLLDNVQADDMLLMDSDIIVKHQIDFIDKSYATVCSIQPGYVTVNGTHRFPRMVPFLQYFNLKMIRAHGIKYFDPKKILGGISTYAARYDTGASFYEECLSKKLPYKTINIQAYVNHCIGSSWAKIHDPTEFLRQNRQYL